MNHRNSDPIGFSYYHLSLLSFLRESHPEKLNHKIFIKQRSIMAAQAYAEAFDSGSTIDESINSAMQTLYQGLHFSRHDTIVNILMREFSREVDPAQAKERAIELFPYLKPYFNRYDIDDNFAYSGEYQSLYTELVGAIQIKLELDGRL